jgi:hypothetical protein
MSIARKQNQKDLEDLIRLCGGGSYSEGLKSASRWINVQDKHIRHWIDTNQRIPDHWLPELQRCAIVNGGRGIEIRIENESRARRKCLRCREHFDSVHVGNRICDNCKKTPNWQKEINGFEEYGVKK